jgi:hypothetical protein
LSTLTKVFIVLLVVFSIAFTTMTISMVAQQSNWRDAANKFREHARVADANLRLSHAVNATELAAAKETINGHLDRVKELEKQLRASQNEVARHQSELARASSEKSSSDAIHRGLLAQLQTAEAARAEYQTQRDELERRNIDLERRNVDLNDRVNELTAQVAVMMEQQRQFEQQINVLTDANQRVSRRSGVSPVGSQLEDARGRALPEITARTPVAASAIRGHVVEVDGELVTLSVGSADGVQKDMVFVVFRGDQYVGDVKITLVDPKRSAGRRISGNVSPRSGDQVTDSLGLGSTRG